MNIEELLNRTVTTEAIEGKYFLFVDKTLMGDMLLFIATHWNTGWKSFDLAVNELMSNTYKVYGLTLVFIENFEPGINCL